MRTPRGLGPVHGAQWQDDAMAAAYVHRPPYPPATFEFLRGLAVGAPPQRALDVGAGTGDLARGLVAAGMRVDALEPSAAMRRVGEALPNGRDDGLRWLAGSAESAALEGPYDLITAGESLHWMDWDSAFPRLAAPLEPGAVLAVVERRGPAHPWSAALSKLVAQYSTNTDFEPYDVFALLDDDPRFDRLGEHETELVAFTQSVAEHVDAMHSRNGFSRDRMTRDAAARFDAAYRSLLAAHGVRESVETKLCARIVWGHLGA